MRVLLSKIGENGLAVKGEVPAELLELDGVSARPEGAIQCDFFAQIASDRLIVSGRVALPVCLECVRCGVFFSTTVADSAFLRDYLITPEVLEVDLTESIREAVLLSLPLYPVCGEGCKGRCLHCGVNRNATSCECSEEPAGGLLWSALDGMNLERDKGPMAR